jgi:hypothetical protein
MTGDLNVIQTFAQWTRTFRRAYARDCSLSDNEEYSYVTAMLRGIEHFQNPVLILTSECDLIAEEFVNLCGQDSGWARAIGRPTVTLIEVKGADHTFSDRIAQDRVVALCDRWLRDSVCKNYS